MGRRPILMAFGLFLVMAVLATFALLTGDDPAEDTEPGAAPLRLPAEPAWSTEVDHRFYTEFAMLDRTILARKEGRLLAVDTESGATRWSLAEGDELLDGGGSRVAPWSNRAGLVTREGETAVVLEDFRCADCTAQDQVIAPTGERGLTLLSAEDRSVLWRTVTVPDGEQQIVEVVRTGDRMVLVGFSRPSSQDETVRLFETIAYDLRDGSRLWSAKGWPLAVADDVVLLHMGLVPPAVDPGVGVLQDATVRAVSADTGEEKWHLAGLYDRTELLLVAGDVAFVRAADVGKKHTRGVLVTLDRGLLLEEVGYGTFDGCATDGAVLIACPRDGDLLTFQVADGTVTIVPTNVEFGVVDSVWDDRIFVRHGPDTRSIDRAGALVDGDLPGALVGRSGDILVLSTEEQGTGMEILNGYRLRG